MNNWLAVGDRNTAFFHKSATTRRIRNSINRLKRPDNTIATAQKYIEETIIDYYATLFSSQHTDMADIQNISDMISSAVSSDMNCQLSIPFSKEKVKKVVFDHSPTKALGPDGFTALFYQNAWEIIGDEVSEAVLGVLNNGDPLDKWNTTFVTLIPKVKNPSTMKEF